MCVHTHPLREGGKEKDYFNFKKREREAEMLQSKMAVSSIIIISENAEGHISAPKAFLRHFLKTIGDSSLGFSLKNATS